MDLLKKMANKKSKRIKEKCKMPLFILYNSRDFDYVFSDKRRKRIKEK